MNGKLTHKASDHNTKRCEVEKWVFLPHSDFERLKENPYQEHEAITAAKDLMYEDKNAYHCIMLLDEFGDDGLLIEAEGFDYPRLSMFVPDAMLHIMTKRLTLTFTLSSTRQMSVRAFSLSKAVKRYEAVS